MAEEIRVAAAGFSLTPPEDWQAGEDDGRIALAPPGGGAFVVVVPHAASSAEGLTPLLEQGWSEPGMELAPTGPPEDRDGGVAVDLAGRANDQDAVGRLLILFSPHGGGTLLVGVAPAGGEEVPSLVDAVAANVSFFEPDPTELIRAWEERLSGRTLTYLSQYSSNSGGIQERHQMVLHPDGTFEQEGEFVASLGDAGSVIEQVSPPTGVWQLAVVAGQPFLRLGDGDPVEYALAEEEGEVFLSGRRYFVT